jgi:L-fuconolactonase
VIIDAHAHVWRHWPYEPAVPDPESRATAAKVLWQMDRNGVDRAIVIAASIGGNHDNADYAFSEADKADGRLIVFPDLECRWSPHYHAPGAAERLSHAVSRWSMRGFTLYPTESESGEWLTSAEGDAFLCVAERQGLIASLSLMPHQLVHATEAARRHPGMTFLLHHHLHLGPRSGTTEAARPLVEPVAECPNIWVKISGIGNCAGEGDEYPWPDLAWVGRLLLDLFGPKRLVWGSDYPVSRKCMTYRQSLDAFRRHWPVSDEVGAAILGGNLRRLLEG